MSHRLLPQFCRFKSPFGGEQTAKVELEIVSRVKHEGKVRQGGGSSSGGEEEAVWGELGQEERWKQRLRETQRQAGAERGWGGNGGSGKEKDTVVGLWEKEYSFNRNLLSSFSRRLQCWQAQDGRGPQHITPAGPAELSALWEGEPSGNSLLGLAAWHPLGKGTDRSS